MRAAHGSAARRTGGFGIVHSEAVHKAVFVWGVIAGAHATGMTSVEPCNPGDDCSDAFIGPTLRAEAALSF